jgi:hypothetical protein
MKSKSYILGLAAALMLILSLGSAQATSVSGPFITSTPISSTLTDWNGSLAFQKFNPALGTLLSMDLKLTGSISTVLTIKNTSLLGSIGTAKTQETFQVQDPGLNLTTDVPDISTSAFAFSLAGGQTVTTGTLTKTTNSTESYTAPAVLAEFTGAGNMILNAGTQTIAWIGYSGGNTEASQVTHASLTGQVTYFYEPVPEPATLSLLVLGGLAYLRRKS